MVVATGGYVCFPVVVAARILRTLRILRCGIALLEINVTPGLTNRLLAPLVDEVWTTYAASAPRSAAKRSSPGRPVRASLRDAGDPPPRANGWDSIPTARRSSRWAAVRARARSTKPSRRW
jgi:UDP-N-acetylglucosamine:LPS N-acetylglucosamine transferase